MKSSPNASSVRPTIGQPREVLTFAALGFAFGSLCCLVRHPLAYGAAALCFAFAAVFVAGLIFPKRFVVGVRMVPGGFERYSPLRGCIAVAFDDIERIVVVSRGEGDTSDELTYVVHTHQTKVSVQDVDVYTTELSKRFVALPGFMPEALREASAHEANLLQAFVGKRFTVMDRSAAKVVEPCN